MVVRNCDECEIEMDVKDNSFKLCRTCKVQRQRNRCKAYKAKNRAHVSAYNKIYKKEYKDDISVYNKKYAKENKEAITKRRAGYMKKYYTKYPKAKIMHAHAARVISILKWETGRTVLSKSLLGCSREFFIRWLEFQFEENQTIDNHGPVWHLDHCLPCTVFDAHKKTDLDRCFHWTNLQPLGGSENQSKGNRTDKMEQWLQTVKINAFIKLYGKEFEGKYTTLDFNRYKYICE